MTTKEFFEEYNKAANKEMCASKHVIRKYIPYSEKLGIVEKIIDNAMYTSINGVKTFKPDTTVRYFLFVMAVIEAYTDIRFSDDKVDDIVRGQQNLESFDLFESNGATEVLMTAIGADIGRFNTVLKMKVDDVMDMERSLVPFLDTKIQAFAMSNNVLIEAIREAQEKVDNNAE